jgi:YD repeat-containing protein
MSSASSFLATDSGNNTTSYAYDPASNLSTATYPNGVESTITYDALNRITTSTSPAIYPNR